jgi:hypothetical protein
VIPLEKESSGFIIEESEKGFALHEEEKSFRIFRCCVRDN